MTDAVFVLLVAMTVGILLLVVLGHGEDIVGVHKEFDRYSKGAFAESIKSIYF